MDLRKEIKFSDLLPKRRAKGEPKPKAEKAAREPRVSRFSRKNQDSAPTETPKRAQKPKMSGRTKKLVGLKVGSSQIAAARIVNNGSPQLVQIARDELDSGIVVGGELRETEELAAVLKRFFRKHKLPRQNVRLGISNNRIGVRAFEIAGVDDEKQLANAIKYRAQETLPIPVEEAVLDYQILGERTDEEGVLHRKVLLVVAYRDLIDRYAAACKKAGIRLAGIDLEAFAILRALAPPPGDEAAGSAIVVVNVGHDRTTFAVSDGKTCEFTRVLDWGGRSLDMGIARALDLSPSEAAPIKLALSLTEPSIPAGLTSDQADRVREAVVREVHEFARELVSSLQFYQSQPGSLGIGEIVLTGGTAQLPGLAAELSRLLGVRARVGDPLAHVKVGKKVDREQQLGSLTSAIGLGIES
ncbi:MAG TPA: type IV pilus assembly protein PilM [Gaiellaceae bacterium]|nr:type IV pilus assembly protein PilM [Gaiellaceae bacterium]